MSDMGEIGTSHFVEELPSAAGHVIGIVIFLRRWNADSAANFRVGDHRLSWFARLGCAQKSEPAFRLRGRELRFSDA